MKGVSTRTWKLCDVPKLRRRAPRSSRHTLASTTKLQSEALISWAETFVDDFRRVRLLENQDQLTLVASEALRENSVVFSLPKSSWITMETVRGSSIGPLITELEPWLQFSLFLISEVRNSASNWTPYLTTLPETLSSPAFWTEDRLQTIKGSQLHEAATGYRLFFRQQYDQLVETVFQKDPELFDVEVFSFDRFCWAIGMVRSQLHPPLDKDKISLLPIVVNIGHSRLGNVELKLSSRGLIKSKQNLEVVAVRDVEIGDALLMDYGPEKLDNQLALDYGVYDSLHAQGGYRLTLGIPESDKFIDDKLDVLELCGLDESPTFDLIMGEEPGDELLLFLRLLNLSGPDSFHLEAIFRSEVKEHLLDPISKSNENSVCETMISGCQEALQRYQSIPKSSSTPIEATIYQVCQGERLALEWMLDWFQTRKEDLNKLDYYAELRLQRLGLLDDDGNSTFEDMWKGGIA